MYILKQILFFSISVNSGRIFTLIAEQLVYRKYLMNFQATINPDFLLSSNYNHINDNNHQRNNSFLRKEKSNHLIGGVCVLFKDTVRNYSISEEQI